MGFENINYSMKLRKNIDGWWVHTYTVLYLWSKILLFNKEHLQRLNETIHKWCRKLVGGGYWTNSWAVNCCLWFYHYNLLIKDRHYLCFTMRMEMKQDTHEYDSTVNKIWFDCVIGIYGYKLGQGILHGNSKVTCSYSITYARWVI